MRSILGAFALGLAAGAIAAWLVPPESRRAIEERAVRAREDRPLLRQSQRWEAADSLPGEPIPP